MVQFVKYMLTPIGEISIFEENEMIFEIAFGHKSNNAIVQNTALLEKADRELTEYFTGERKHFDLPLLLNGTNWQEKVWTALMEIPYGETRSYKEIAQAAGNPKGCRAVGNANNKNHLPIVIPCHRVIGAQGKMVGFGGGIALKEKLLALEAEHKEALV